MRKSLSIVISAYNEERQIGLCLDSIAAQSDRPDEVIIVDNNSTDDTVRIARSYPFVTILFEKEQGLIPARNTGFAAVRSDLIACVNADAILEPDWVARARAAFEKDEQLGGLTGLAYSDTFPLTHAYMTKFWSRCYFLWAESALRVRVLWGACMIIRKSAWKEIRPEVCLNGSLVHDDQDLSLLLAGHGWKCARDTKLLITTFGHDYNEWKKLRSYIRRRDTTKQRHLDLGTLRMPHAQILPIWTKIVVQIAGAPILGVFMGISYVMWLGAKLWEQARLPVMLEP